MKQSTENLTGLPARAGIIFPEAAKTLEIHEQHVRASTTGAAFVITLPAPETNPGMMYHIWMVARSGTDDITITGGNEGTDIVLNLAGENVVLLSTGVTYVGVYANGPVVP